jgi:hypothetical protein
MTSSMSLYAIGTSSAGTMGGRVQRRGDTFATHDISGRTHRTRDDPQHTTAGRRRTLAVNDKLGLRPIRQAMARAPRKVVMVLDVETHLDTKGAPPVRAGLCSRAG